MRLVARQGALANGQSGQVMTEEYVDNRSRVEFRNYYVWLDVPVSREVCLGLNGGWK